MKKALFILQSARSGGSTSSLLNLVNLLDSERIEISVFFMEHEGTFLEQFRKCVRIVPEEKIISSITYNFSTLKKKGAVSFLIRLLFVILHHLFGKEKILNLFYRISAKKISGKYDIIVAFQESKVTEYVRFINAPKKVAWVHCDYERFAVGRTVNDEISLYDSYTNIVCVSNYAKDSMVRNLEIKPEKICTIYNTILMDSIRKQAQDIVPIQIDAQYKFVSVGRFVSIKDFKKIVFIAERMCRDNIDFKWIVVGDGPEFEPISEMVKKKKLDKYIILVGNQENPYKYMRLANYYVCTSLCETHPMTVLEALSLGIPVISTEYPSVHEILENGNNGYIFPNSVEGLYSGIIKVLKDRKLAAAICEGARKFEYNNGEILNKVYKVLGV